MGAAGSLPASGGSRTSGADSSVAEKLSDLRDARSNNLVYPRFCRPQAEACLPAIHVKG